MTQFSIHFFPLLSFFFFFIKTNIQNNIKWNYYVMCLRSSSWKLKWQVQWKRTKAEKWKCVCCLFPRCLLLHSILCFASQTRLLCFPFFFSLFSLVLYLQCIKLILLKKHFGEEEKTIKGKWKSRNFFSLVLFAYVWLCATRAWSCCWEDGEIRATNS